MRIVSKRPARKQANEQTNGTLPASARPAAMPMAFCSAMPTLKARSGYFFAKLTVMVDFDRSASTLTMRSSRAPSSSNASPKAARVAFAGIGSPYFLSRALSSATMVAVDLDHRPAERLPLLDDRLEVEDLRHEVVELDAVFIEDHGEVADAMRGLSELRPRHGRLPHLAFLDLAVAEDAVHAVRLVAEAKTERQPQRDRQALAERARGRLDAGQRRPIGVTLE